MKNTYIVGLLVTFLLSGCSPELQNSLNSFSQNLNQINQRNAYSNQNTYVNPMNRYNNSGNYRITNQYGQTRGYLRKSNMPGF